MKQFVLLLLISLLFGESPTNLEWPENSLLEELCLEKQAKIETQSIVFIAGFDEGDNTYYANAKRYFQTNQLTIVDSLYSLEEIINWINSNFNDKNFRDIHIVSHSNAWLGMSLKSTKDGMRITTQNLDITKHDLPKLKNGITSDTKIIFHSCGLGDNIELLAMLRCVFTIKSPPTIYASSYFNIFGGKYADHYLAKPYYGYYPTAKSPGLFELSKTFENRYPSVNIDWLTSLKARNEQGVGTPYSYKFNIPIEWTFNFIGTEKMPLLTNKNDIMDWILESEDMTATLFQLGIPIELFRWRATIQKNSLIIKGKTTILCVMQPIMQTNDPNEYKPLNLSDNQLYIML